MGPPLAAAQFALLCALRFVDPLTFTQIFPYINQLLAALHLVDDPANIGFYSGLVESTFAFFQLCSIYQWARLSDSIGRRPVIIATTFGLALATLLFGFASSLPVILLSRALAGICSGNAAVLHSVLGELTSPATEAVAFSTYGLFWPLGSIVGPILGGALADPATYYPRMSVFQNDFFRDYPYFLPSITTGFLTFVIGCLAMGSLRETLPGKCTLPVSSSAAASAATDSEDGPPPPLNNPRPHHRTPSCEVQPVSLGDLLQHPVLRRLAFSGALLCFTATAFDALFVLFCYTPVELGGLSFTSHQIGTALALAGSSSILLQVFLLPSLLCRISHARLYTVCMLAWPITYAMVPLLNLIVRHGAAPVEFGVPMQGNFGPMELEPELKRQTVLGLGLSSENSTTGMSGLWIRLGNGIAAGGGSTGGWGEEGPHLTVLVTYGLWTAIVVVMVLSRVGCLAYSISLVLVKQNAPSPAALGKANGIVLWAMCLARAGAPAFVSSFFAWSTTHRVLGGNLWLVVMLAVALAGCTVSRGIERAVGRMGMKGGRAMGFGLGEEEEEGEGSGVEWEAVEAVGERETYAAAWREREGALETEALLPAADHDHELTRGRGEGSCDSE